MLYTIGNEQLSVTISSYGAELQSIRNSQGVEYLWQGNPIYWNDRAINLFPYVGRLTEGTYLLQNKRYQMDIHGFIKSSNFQAEQTSLRSVSFWFCDDTLTRMQYPYSFLYRESYEVSQGTIIITYEILNRCKHEMHFGIGGHPGFNVPLDVDLEFSDYYLEFSNACKPFRVGMSKECFVSGIDEPFPLINGNILPLNHGLFVNDAIILTGMDSTVTLKCDKNDGAVSVCFPQMRYLGLWHKPNTDAPYLCIEPWASLPSRQGIIEDLEQQPDLICLPVNETYRNTWSIRIE